MKVSQCRPLRTLNVSSSAVAKNIKRYETGSHEDRHRKGRPRVTSKNCCKETTTKKDTNKKRLAWAKKHKQWKLEWYKSVLWSDESKFKIFGSNRRVFVIHRVGEHMISACVVPTVKHGGGGVMAWGCFAGDTIIDLFRFQGTLNQHGYHNILQRYDISSGLGLVGLSFVFQQDIDPTHL